MSRQTPPSPCTHFALHTIMQFHEIKLYLGPEYHAMHDMQIPSAPPRQSRGTRALHFVISRSQNRAK